ncbi:hypothetical protein CapIbe_007342 [Capra ibex]
MGGTPLHMPGVDGEGTKHEALLGRAHLTAAPAAGHQEDVHSINMDWASLCAEFPCTGDGTGTMTTVH